MNSIANIITKKEIPLFRHTPTTEFFKTIQIGKKRWGQLMRGEKSPTIYELQSIASFFNIKITDLI